MVRIAPLTVFSPSRLIHCDGGRTVSSPVNITHILLVLALVYVPSAEDVVVLVKYSGAGCRKSNHDGDAYALKKQHLRPGSQYELTGVQKMPQK